MKEESVELSEFNEITCGSSSFKNFKLNSKTSEIHSSVQKTEQPDIQQSKIDNIKRKGIKKDLNCRVTENPLKIKNHSFDHSSKELKHENCKDEVLSIMIHSCDRLKTDIPLLNPVVRIHVIDFKTGTYMKKLKKERAVVSFYENQQKDIDFIMPIMTQSAFCKGKRSLQPTWEERLIFNELFTHFIDPNQSTILFFEILDFYSTSSVGKHYRQFHNKAGWYQIAWAFLKLVSSNSDINIGTKLRLQLYKPYLNNTGTHSSSFSTSSPEVFAWWSKHKRVHIDSSLYVSIEPLISHVVEPALRSFSPMQEEQGKTSFHDLTNAVEVNSVSSNDHLCNPVKISQETTVSWSRKSHEPCKIPNKSLLTLNTCNSSCFAIIFNHNGRILAAGCGAREQHFLLIYEIPSGNLLNKIHAHSGIIYELNWSFDDKFLLSASNDCCVKVWSVLPFECTAVIAHPSFVYSAKFHPSSNNLLGTACYDGIARLWMIDNKKRINLLKEFEGHKCHINTLCWSPFESYMFSADNIGELKVWSVKFSGELSKKDISSWCLKKTICLPEIKGIPINKIILSKDRNNEILLFCRDNLIRLLDIQSEKMIKKYSGSLVCQNFIHGCCTPCGGFIYLGDEDGKVHVWDFNTAEKMATYLNLPYHLLVSCVDYHPFDHILAMCSVEDNYISLYIYDKECTHLNENQNIKIQVSKLYDSRKADYELTDPYSSLVKLHSAHNNHQTTFSPNFQVNQTIAVKSVPQNIDLCITKETKKEVTPNVSGSGENSKMRKNSGNKNSVPSDDDEKKFTAIVTKSGSLEILSEPDDLDDACILSSGGKKLTKKQHCDLDFKQLASGVAQISKRHRRRILQKMAMQNS